MNLYANIKFSNDLIENEACNITYSGYLFEKNSACVSIVYGFGPEWKHTTEQKMEKTDEGFVATVNMRNFDTFNFCFKNLDNEWDNNYNQNYTSPISKPVIKEIQNVTETTPEYNFILNDESVITNILDNLFAVDLSDETYNQPILIDTVNAEEKSIIEPVENTTFEIEFEVNEPVNIEETLVNSTEAETLSQDIECIFNDFYQNTEENVNVENIKEVETNTSTIQNTIEFVEENNFDNDGEFNMDNLIDEILSPIVKSSVFDEETKDSLENYTPVENTTVNFFDDFEDFEDDLSVDNKIDTLIADLFNNTKEARAKAEAASVAIIEEKVQEPASVVEEKTVIENFDIAQELSLNEVNFEQDLEKAIDNRIEELLSTGPEIETVEEPQTFDLFNELFEEDEPEEESLIETLNESKEENTSTALVEVPNDNDFVVSPRTLGKFYMFKKKVKLAFTKLFVALPRFLAKGLNNENN